MLFLDGPLDVDPDVDEKEGENKSDGVMMIGPDYDEYCVDDGHERKAPGKPIDHDSLSAGGGELIDDGTKQEDVDDGPNEEGPTSWGEIRLLDVFVYGLRGDCGVNI